MMASLNVTFYVGISLRLIQLFPNASTFTLILKVKVPLMLLKNSSKEYLAQSLLNNCPPGSGYKSVIKRASTFGWQNQLNE